MITIDKTNIKYFIDNDQYKTSGYCHFFYPEIINLLDEEKAKRIEDEIKKTEGENIENYGQFNKFRLIGENSTNISSLIREDLIDEFCILVSKKDIPLSSRIRTSIFETNSFLIGKNPTLIEYAAFFGSIQIFNFLRMNQVDFDSTLWIYAIHSKNAELIHILESINLRANEKTYEESYRESIKCHHNEFADYIKDILLNPNFSNQINEQIISTIFKYSNYSLIPVDFKLDIDFFNLIKYNHSKLVKSLNTTKIKQIKQIKILEKINNNTKK